MTKLKITPRSARYYLFFAAILIVLPTILVKFFPSHAGRVIVSAGKMDYSVFQKSVIFMTQHNGYSATGFIINKPMPEDLKAMYQERFPLIRHFHYGGPVGEESEFFLMVKDEKGPGGYMVYNGKLLQEQEPEQFNEFVANEQTAMNVRLFAGYSGWGPMQLNKEIYRGFWDAINFDEGYISEDPDNEIWNKAVEQVLREKKAAIDVI